MFIIILKEEIMAKILVTGAGGFIGSHLVERLVRDGHKVRAFIRYNSKNNWGWLERSNIKDDIEVYTGDIRDFDSVNDAIKDVEVIFHLAALIGIPYSYVSPLAYIKTNVEGTYNILEASRLNNIKRIIITSTSEIYGTAKFVPITEEHPVNPQSPYAASKVSADLLALSYYLSFGTPVVIARPFNTFGPRQSARAFIPSVIIQILSNKKIIEVGNLETVRDMNYVKDTVEGFVSILKTKGIEGQVLNICSGKEISMNNILKEIIKITGSKVKIKESKERIRPDKSEVLRLLGSNKKIKKITDWSTKYSIEEGLEETIKWFKDNMDIYKSDIYNI